MRVADVIASRTEVFSITDDMTAHAAACYLRDKRVRAVGVLNRQGKLVGVVSEGDIARKVVAEAKSPVSVRVGEIMSTPLVTVRPDALLEECLLLMDQHHIFHPLVVDENSNYLGMVTVTDLLRVLATHHKARADLYEAYIFPPR